MKILVSYRGIPQSPGWATGDLVVKAFRAMGHDVTPYGNYYLTNKWIEDVDPAGSIKNHEYDLALYMECNDADPGYAGFKMVKARKTACWFFDTSYYSDHLTNMQKFFNYNIQFIANPRDLGYFPNAVYLPYAVDAEFHSRTSVNKKYDFLLPGTVRPDRVLLTKELERRGIKLELIGGLFREEYIDSLAAARFVINQNPTEGRSLLNMRFWEAQAAGAIVLTEGVDFFENEAACNRWGIASLSGIPYNDLNDLVRICEDIKNRPVTNEQEYILRHHTYRNRCQKILEVLFPNEA